MQLFFRLKAHMFLDHIAVHAYPIKAAFPPEIVAPGRSFFRSGFARVKLEAKPGQVVI
jgi:hypothetical protein